MQMGPFSQTRINSLGVNQFPGGEIRLLIQPSVTFSRRDSGCQLFSNAFVAHRGCACNAISFINPGEHLSRKKGGTRENL